MFDTYSSQIDLALLNNFNNFDSTLGVVKRYTLKGCFPTIVGDIKYENTTKGNVAQISIQFAYQYLEEKDEKLDLNLNS